MTRYLKISLVLIGLSLCLHTYLTFHYYQINFGQDIEKSSCNINTTFNCDAVALSPFATLMGIPLSLLGGLTHLMLLLLVLWPSFGWVQYPQRIKTYSLWLSGFIAGMSILMFFISITQLSSYCIYCLSTYVLSFLTLFAIWKDQKQEMKSSDESRLTLWEGAQGLFTHSKALLIMMFMIPLLSNILHRQLLEKYSNTKAKKINLAIKRSLSSWKVNPKFEFSSSPSLTKGPPPDKAVMTVTEFADFFCIHCKHASSRLRVFTSAHPKVRFEFYNFPIGGCPQEDPDSRGLSCQVAKAIHCAGKQSHQWTLHDLIFKKQDEFKKTTEVQSLIRTYAEASLLNWEKLSSCMNLNETQDAILSQIEDANKAQLKSTPTIYVNGRKLPHGHRLPILSAAYKSIKK